MYNNYGIVIDELTEYSMNSYFIHPLFRFSTTDKVRFKDHLITGALF